MNSLYVGLKIDDQLTTMERMIKFNVQVNSVADQVITTTETLSAGNKSVHMFIIKEAIAEFSLIDILETEIMNLQAFGSIEVINFAQLDTIPQNIAEMAS